MNLALSEAIRTLKAAGFSERRIEWAVEELAWDVQRAIDAQPREFYMEHPEFL